MNKSEEIRLSKNERLPVQGAMKYSLPLEGGGRGWGCQWQAGRELADLIAALTVLTLPLTPSRRGRGDSLLVCYPDLIHKSINRNTKTIVSAFAGVIETGA